MGIPLYFRYLIKNYPNIILNVMKKSKIIDDEIFPVPINPKIIKHAE